MARNTKSQQYDFNQGVIGVCKKFNPTPSNLPIGADHYAAEYEFETVCGTLLLKLPIDQSLLYSIYLRFEPSSFKSDIFYQLFDRSDANRLNSSSLKWNLLDSNDGWFAITELEERLEILVNMKFNDKPIVL